MQSATLKQTNHVTEPDVLVVEDGHRLQVGIMGGTFNPPHIGHLVMAEQVRSNSVSIKFCLCQMPIHRTLMRKKTLPAKHRVAMVERAIADNSHFELDLTEIERGGVSYTYDTIVALKQQHPEIDYYFIIGGDMVDYLPTWYRIDDLVQLVQFVGVKRTGYAQQTPYPVLWVDAPVIDVSSTQIRNKIQQGCSVRYLLPDPVFEYIQKEGLYHE